LVLYIPAAIVSSLQEQPASALTNLAASLAAIPAAIGSMWFLVVLLFEAAIFSQYLDRGIRGALNVRRVLERVRVNVALTIVVGALVIVLTAVGLIGLLGLLVGALITLPYASFVGAYLVGEYARATDREHEPTADPNTVSV
jgi:predicted PurR-regulated permease PerM